MADPAEADDEGPDVPETAAPAAGSGTPSPPAAAPAVGSGAVPTTLPAPSIDGLVVTPGQMEKTRQQLLEIQKAKMASQDHDRVEISSRLDRDRARMEQAYKASAAEPIGLEPWDAQKKAAEHYTDPVQAFGSVGSVFAMLASSFAGLPMEAGLNAGAAAINAIHQGDEKAYNREFEAWQKNTELAVKRHEMQRQAYNDATTLMNSNINAGRTKMEMAATKFGDQKVQALLENGMDKELTDLFVARNKSAAEMQDQWDKIQLQHDKVTDLRSDPRYTSGNPELKNQAITEWTQRWAPNSSQKLRYDATADYVAAQKRANPNWTPDDLAKWQHDAANAAEPDKEAKPTGPLSSGKMKSAAIQEIVDNSKKEVEAGTRPAPKTIAEATAEYNRGAATPTGNRLDDIDKQIGMYDNGKSAIDRTLALIDKHTGSVGAAGYVTRLGERLGNVVGSNETDRVQLSHDIQYLQTIAPRLMQDASSRGLKAEADKINSMIAGLNMGDTTANTKRALQEVRQLWDKMQQDNVNRRRGISNPATGAGPSGPNSEGAGAPPSAAKPGAAAPKWQSAPIVKPRAELGSDQAYG
jgi:hypothetical protein